jgi:hypothetical protein
MITGEHSPRIVDLAQHQHAKAHNERRRVQRDDDKGLFFSLFQFLFHRKLPDISSGEIVQLRKQMFGSAHSRLRKIT